MGLGLTLNHLATWDSPFGSRFGILGRLDAEDQERGVVVLIDFFDLMLHIDLDKRLITSGRERPDKDSVLIVGLASLLSGNDRGSWDVVPGNFVFLLPALGAQVGVVDGQSVRMVGSARPTRVPHAPPQDSVATVLGLACWVEPRELAVEVQRAMEFQFLLLRFLSWRSRIAGLRLQSFLHCPGDRAVADTL